MTSRFRKGDVCIWQDQIGDRAWMNGTETTLTSDCRLLRDKFTHQLAAGHLTSTYDENRGCWASALPSHLRLKAGPITGERYILQLFDLEHRPSRTSK